MKFGKMRTRGASNPAPSLRICCANAANYLERLTEKSSVVHCITNTVTVNDCANAVLAVGARPVMAEHPRETAQITAAAGALLINTGSLTDSKIAAMKESARSAKEHNIPFVLDCVGIASSDVRYETVKELLEINIPDIIKGNASEITALCKGVMSDCGVDATGTADETAVRAFAKQHGSVIVVTGETDIITDGMRTVHVKNGCDMLTKVTGTGCMLGCIMAAVATVADKFSAAVYAAAIMGICGEIADGSRGTGTLRMSLMDNLSTITDKDISEKIKIEG